MKLATNEEKGKRLFVLLSALFVLSANAEEPKIEYQGHYSSPRGDCYAAWQASCEQAGVDAISCRNEVESGTFIPSTYVDSPFCPNEGSPRDLYRGNIFYTGYIHKRVTCPEGGTLDSTKLTCNPPAKNAGPPKECVGNPCDPATGNKYQSEVDYAGEIGRTGFQRSYNSVLVSNDYGLGHGWIAMSLRRLELFGSALHVREGNGHGERFTKTGGAWIGEADSQFQLSEDATGFTLTQKDGTVERYDLGGRLLLAKDRTNKTTTYTYNTTGKLLSVTGPFGHTLTFTYDSTGHLHTMTDPAGELYTYSYDANNNLTQVTYPDGSSKTYHYENATFPHHLTGISDETGQRFATYTYDSEGRAVSTEHAGGQERFGFSYE